jgi:[NiFe] hydrogenase diaphorase moiety small subunit
MFCEKSGNCELQAMGYRLGVTAPTHPYLHPGREVDASHPDILLDHNRCILCARCVRTSRDLDGKEVFSFVNRGAGRRISIDPGARLKDSDADVTDRALDACPVGALLRKREGFRVPVGEREYDHVPIGEEERVNPVSQLWPTAAGRGPADAAGGSPATTGEGPS